MCGAGIQGAEGAQAHAAKTGVHVCVRARACACACVFIMLTRIHTPYVCYSYSQGIKILRRTSEHVVKEGACELVSHEPRGRRRRRAQSKSREVNTISLLILKSFFVVPISRSVD